MTLRPGTSATVGFRVALPAEVQGQQVGPTVVSPPVESGVTAEPDLLVEADAVAGGLTISASLGAPPGDWTVTVGGQAVHVHLEARPPVQLSAAQMRRSTLAGLDPRFMYALAEDGTVWATLLDGGAERVPGMSGIRSITANGAQTMSAVSLESETIDIRGDVRHLLSVKADGSLTGTLLPITRNDVVAARPFSLVVNGTESIYNDWFLTKDGSVVSAANVNSGLPVSSVIDLGPLAASVLMSDGTVLQQNGSSYDALFRTEGLRDYEGRSRLVYQNQVQNTESTALWRTPDGVAWAAGAYETPTQALVPPAGVEVKDVFAREAQTYLLGTNGKLYAVEQAMRELPFPSVRKASPGPDVGVFAEGIPFRRGEQVSVPLRVRREDYEGALTLTPRNLPSDVIGDVTAIAAGSATGTLRLRFTAEAHVRPLELEFAVEGADLRRTALLSLELPRTTRLVTVAGSLAVKTDGTVWRYEPSPPVQVAGLSGIIAVTRDLALSASGTVYDVETAAPIPGLPTDIKGLSRSNRVAMALDALGRVWWWGYPDGSAQLTGVTMMTGLPKIIDVNGDNSAAALGEDGGVFLIPSGRSLGTTTCARLGITLNGAPATVDHNYCIFGNGALGFAANLTRAVWCNGWLTLGDGSACQSSCQANSIVAYTCPPNGIQDAAYATPEGTVLKFDGTLWKASSAVPTQIIGIAGVALTQ